jgi:hypothetical protein
MPAEPAPISRLLALLALLFTGINVACAAMSLQDGIWQKVLPLTVIAAGAVIGWHLLGLLNGKSGTVAANMLWRWVAAFAFFAGVFSLLILAFDSDAWAVTKQAPRASDGFTGVDARLRDSVDMTGPLNAASLFILNFLLGVVGWIGSRAEDANPSMPRIA